MTPLASIEAVGSRQSHVLTAIVDTGFSGELCLPTQIAVQLGLELIGEELIELADGTQKQQLVFTGSVRFFGEIHKVEIMLTNSGDALIGTRLVNKYKLSIEFPGARVKVPSKPPTGGKRKDK
jgi:clan AA aspartic protease